MTLTRHLYELDEVVAALQQGLRDGVPDADFWLWELLVSEEEAVADKALNDAWLLWSGGRGLCALTLPPGPAKFAVLRTACHPPIALPTPVPAKATGTVRAERLHQFVATLSPLDAITEAPHFWIALDSACRRYAKGEALWIVRAAQQRFTAATIWSALRVAARGPAAPIVREIIDHLEKISGDPAAIVLVLCAPASAQVKLLTLNATGSPIDWTPWNALLGRRKVRRPIPHAALHTGTTRGSMPPEYTNIADVREPLWLLAEGCRWWQKTYASYSEETHDEFHDTYFPDDIPDEWSAADQQMSHGVGCAPTQDWTLSFPIITDAEWFAPKS